MRKIAIYGKGGIDILKGLERTLVLADDTAARIIPESNTFMRIATPLIDGSQIAAHMPVMGPRGADMLREYIDGYLNTLK